MSIGKFGYRLKIPRKLTSIQKRCCNLSAGDCDAMGRASELAAEIDGMRAAGETASKRTMDAYTVIADHGDQLWEISATATVGEIEEFIEKSQEARNAYLSCVRLDPNTLIVSTKVVPLFKLEIRYSSRRCISYRVAMEQFTACSLSKSGAHGEFRFTVDRQLQPYLTDGVRFLVPQQIADELMNLVGDFFKRAQVYPSILS